MNASETVRVRPRRIRVVITALALLFFTTESAMADSTSAKQQKKKSAASRVAQSINRSHNVVLSLTIMAPDYAKPGAQPAPSPDYTRTEWPKVAEGNYIFAGTYKLETGNADRLLAELADQDFKVAQEIVWVEKIRGYGKRVLVRYENEEEFEHAIDYLQDRNKRTGDDVHPYVIVKRDGEDTFSRIKKIEESYKKYVAIVAEPKKQSGKNALLPYYELVLAIAKRHGMETKQDLALIYAIMEVESNLNPLVANSSAGAIGIMQVMPGTALLLDLPRHERKKLTKHARRLLLGQYEKILQDPVRNIEYGIAAIKDAKKRFGDDVRKIAADYNGGGSHVKNPLPETVEYIAKVKRALPKYEFSVAAK